MSKTSVQTVALQIVQGDCATFLLEFFAEDGTTPVDVSDWVFESQIRTYYNSLVILASFSFSQVGYDPNQVMMSLTAEQTEPLPTALPTCPGQKNITTLSYDLKATVTDGCIYTVQQGPVYVTPSVTQP